MSKAEGNVRCIIYNGERWISEDDVKELLEKVDIEYTLLLDEGGDK